MGDLFQISRVNPKTPRMTHRFSLRFVGLNSVITRAAANQLTNLTSGPGTEQGNIWGRLGLAAKGNTTGSDGDALATNLELSLLSVSVPSIEMETVEVARFHDTAKHISKFTTMGDINITFYDYVNGSASAILFIWQSLVGDKRTGAISYKSEYTLREARLIEYGPKAPAESAGTEYKLAEHALINLYPKTIELGEHSYDSADVRKIQCTFALDNIYPVYYRTANVSTDVAE
jgi:hypothetical protein